MDVDFQKLRLDGIYRQDQDNHLMLRLKLPAGQLSNKQAVTVCDIADQFGDGMLHLTSRGNVEFHWLKLSDIEAVRVRLASAGLTSRGACGGAVRGISCSLAGHDRFPQLALLAEQLQRHFTGQPNFEGLPKKFKIGIEADTASGRHLIQDAGIVLRSQTDDQSRYDLWVGGGLGREPKAGILLQSRLGTDELIPLLEKVIAVYQANADSGRRLKHLLAAKGEDWFREQVGQTAINAKPAQLALSQERRSQTTSTDRLDVKIFAGEISTRQLRGLAHIAQLAATGNIVVTIEQNIAIPAVQWEKVAWIEDFLKDLQLAGENPELRIPFRICPGNHACRMGLAATRDVARQVIAALGPKGKALTWAVSGCPNSCSQPQLADVGIVVKKLRREEGRPPAPVFEIWRRRDHGLGECILQDLELGELLEAVRSFG